MRADPHPPLAFDPSDGLITPFSTVWNLRRGFWFPWKGVVTSRLRNRRVFELSLDERPCSSDKKHVLRLIQFRFSSYIQ